MARAVCFAQVPSLAIVKASRACSGDCTHGLAQSASTSKREDALGVSLLITRCRSVPYIKNQILGRVIVRVIVAYKKNLFLLKLATITPTITLLKTVALLWFSQPSRVIP